MPAHSQLIFELSHPISPTTMHGPAARAFDREINHPFAPFLPDQQIYSDTILSESDAISMGTHAGTHVDSLLHVRRGAPAPDNPDSPPIGVRPIVTRGVLLDFPQHFGRSLSTETLTDADILDCARTQGTPLRAGDAVLIRTGSDELYGTPAFLEPPFGGPGVDAAHLLVEVGVAVVGSDTMPFEAAPSEAPLEVHAVLIADSGIQIIEMLDLRGLAHARVYEFTFVMAPLRIIGGTGSPVNPLALLPEPL